MDKKRNMKEEKKETVGYLLYNLSHITSKIDILKISEKHSQKFLLISQDDKVALLSDCSLGLSKTTSVFVGSLMYGMDMQTSHQEGGKVPVVNRRSLYCTQ